MNYLKLIFIVLLIKQSYSKVIYGENCAHLIEGDQPFKCEQENYHDMFQSCYFPKKMSNKDGCFIDLEKSKIFNTSVIFSK